MLFGAPVGNHKSNQSRSLDFVGTGELLPIPRLRVFAERSGRCRGSIWFASSLLASWAGVAAAGSRRVASGAMSSWRRGRGRAAPEPQWDGEPGRGPLWAGTAGVAAGWRCLARPLLWARAKAVPAGVGYCLLTGSGRPLELAGGERTGLGSIVDDFCPGWGGPRRTRWSGL